MKVSDYCINNITKVFEGIHDGDLSEIGLQPKQDCSGYWTVGYGRLVIMPDGHPATGESGKERADELYDTITEEQAVQFLHEDFATVEKELNKRLTNINQNQFDALADFTYNLGIGNLLNSTLYKKVKINPSDPTIADEFKKWNKSCGKVLPGLVRRREAESILYFEPI